MNLILKLVDEKDNGTTSCYFMGLFPNKKYHFKSVPFELPINVLFLKNCTCPTFSLQI